MSAQEVAALCVQAQQGTGTGMGWVQGKDAPHSWKGRSQAELFPGNTLGTLAFMTFYS